MAHDEPSTDWPRLLKAAAFEVRQALISIPGYVRFLQAGRGGPLRDNVLRVVDEIGRAARRVTEAADKLEMLARLEAGRFDQPRIIMSLSETIHEFDDQLRQSGREVEIDLDVNPGTDQVIARGNSLRQAITAVLEWKCLGGVVRDQGPGKLRLLELGPRAISVRVIDHNDVNVFDQRWMVVAGADQIQEAVSVPRANLTRFNENQDPVTLDLPLAKRIIALHHGQLWALPGDLRGAVITLPRPKDRGERRRSPGRLHLQRDPAGP